MASFSLKNAHFPTPSKSLFNPRFENVYLALYRPNFVRRKPRLRDIIRVKVFPHDLRVTQIGYIHYERTDKWTDGRQSCQRRA